MLVARLCSNLSHRAELFDNSDIPLHTLFHAAQKGWQYQHELLRDASVSLDALVDAIGNYPNIYGTHLQT